VPPSEDVVEGAGELARTKLSSAVERFVSRSLSMKKS
jgi:hypothetical protein